MRIQSTPIVVLAAMVILTITVPATAQDNATSWRWDSFEREWEYKTDDIEYEYDPESGEFVVERDRGLMPDQEIARYQWDGTQANQPKPIADGAVSAPPLHSPTTGADRSTFTRDYTFTDRDYEVGDRITRDRDYGAVTQDRDETTAGTYDYRYTRDDRDARSTTAAAARDQGEWEWESLKGEWEFETNDYEYEYDPREGEFEVERKRDFWFDDTIAEYDYRPGYGNEPSAIRQGTVPEPPSRAPHTYTGRRYDYDWSADYNRDYYDNRWAYDRRNTYDAARYDDEQRGWEWESLQGKWEYETDDYEYNYYPDERRLEVQRDRFLLPDETIARYNYQPGAGRQPQAMRQGGIPEPPAHSPTMRTDRDYVRTDRDYQDRDYRDQEYRDQDYRDRRDYAYRDRDDDDRRWEWEPLQGEWEYETNDYEYEYEPDSNQFRVQRDRFLLPDQTISEYQWDPRTGDRPRDLRGQNVPAPPANQRGDARYDRDAW